MNEINDCFVEKKKSAFVYSFFFYCGICILGMNENNGTKILRIYNKSVMLLTYIRFFGICDTES